MPFLVALGGIAVTLAAAGFFRWDADHEAQEKFNLRSMRYVLAVQFCLQEALSASRSISAVAQKDEGKDLSLLRSLAATGENELAPLHSIRWIAFLAAPVGEASGSASPAQPLSAEVVAAGRMSPVAEGGRLALTPGLASAVHVSSAFGKPAVYLPEGEKGIGLPLYLHPVLRQALPSIPMVLVVALDEGMLIKAGLQEFLAREGATPIGHYSIRVLAKAVDDPGARERLLVESSNLERPLQPGSQNLFATGTNLLEHESSIDLDGTRYRILTAVPRAEIEVLQDGVSWWLLIIGLLGTLVLSLAIVKIARARNVAEDTSRQLGSLVRSSEARFRNLVESTRDWMWETSASGEITFSSGRVHALLGVTPREVVGKRCAEFGFAIDLKRAAASGARVEIVVTRRDGLEVRLQCACSRFNDEHGQLAGYRGVCSDITEARMSADRQRVLELELNRMDKIGTLDHVMSMVAHELNQPLAAVASYCGACVRMLRGKTTDLDEVISSMNAAASQAQVAAATVRGIRQFIVHKEPSIGSHRVEGMIRSAISLAAFRLDRAGIRVESAPSPNLPAVLADEILIVQVLLNLLHNAIDAVGELPDPRIVVRAERVEEGRVRVSVEDNGPGMTDEQLARCLEPYVTTKSTGLGLGLSISQAIVESHGGILKLTRNPVSGCTAEFTLEADPALQAPPDSSRMLSRSRN